MSNYDYYRYDAKWSNTVPFKRKVIDKRAESEKIKRILKDKNAKKLLELPLKGSKLKKKLANEDKELFFKFFLEPEIKAVSEKSRQGSKQEKKQTVFERIQVNNLIDKDGSRR